LLNQAYIRTGKKVDSIPQRTSVEYMARQLGVIAELQTAEALMSDENFTLGFDATTQEGVHMNAIYFTSSSRTYAAAVDELPGGTADDYLGHIIGTIDSLCRTYCSFHEDADFEATKSTMISRIR
jgi:hypothetical protein